MRRDLKVNADQEIEEDPDRSWEFPGIKRPGGEGSPKDSAIAPARSPSSRVHGTCLYFGPAGERCDRSTGESGFCRDHQGNIEGKPSTNPGKIIAAIMAILALLWPVLGDVVQFIMRWIRQRHGF